MDDAERCAKDAPESMAKIENIQMIRPKKVSMKKCTDFSLLLSKLIVDDNARSEQIAMKVDFVQKEQFIDEDNGFSGDDDDGFDFPVNDEDLYDDDDDTVIQDDNLISPMYLNHPKYILILGLFRNQNPIRNPLPRHPSPLHSLLLN